MATKGKAHAAGIEGLLEQLPAESRQRKLSRIEIDSLEEQFAQVSAADYRRLLRAHFSPREMRCLIAAMELRVPALNRKSFSNTDLEYLRATAESLGAKLRAAPFGPQMEELRGFYMPTPLASKRPLIFVNTEHDRVAVTSTFWHEMGHHLMDRLGEKAKSIQVMFRSDFSARMSTASELIAETMVALACYPKTAAIALFQRDLKLDRSPDAYGMVLGACRHLDAVADFDFEWEFPPLPYLVGIIHYAKLRWALLAEYGI